MKKKIFILISGVAIIALMVFNTQFLMNSNGERFTLFSNIIQASAQTELPGGGITCNQYCSLGAKCWTDSFKYCMGEGYNFYCVANGDPSSICTDNCC